MVGAREEQAAFAEQVAGVGDIVLGGTKRQDLLAEVLMETLHFRGSILPIQRPHIALD